ncbi:MULTISPECIES: AAA domain-containing protein [unclassified Microcoleus]|uniref:AAA domain-containing protein n=1 Tax=unclassified Microcoleus TaxID=2642155 RepID=UPI002FD3E406
MAASDRFICQIEGSDALNAYPEFRDRHIRADELISELLGSEPCLFYIRKQREARNPEYEIWELIIATDRDNFQLPTKLQERQQTLQFWASVRKDGTGFLGLTRINLVDLEQGQIDAFSSAWLIRLLPYVVQDIGIPQEAFAQIATMPVCSAHVPTTEQIRRVWGQYLDIERRTAEKRQFCVLFVSHNYPVSRQSITFTLNVDLATSNGSVSLTPEEFWQRAGWARNGFVKLFENSAELANRRQCQELGDIETVEKSNNQIKIQLNSNLVDSLSSSNLELPTTGFLFFEDVGSLAQIRWQEQALRNLEEGHTQNLYLGEFFFDAAKARPIPATSPLSKTDLLLSEANETQIAAVEAVLAAEDLILIQGPPGTGKTTVIAEICYQVARRGGRTLVVSQANLAVDNALSRLAHHPLLRPLREGDARTRVGREGEPFLAHRVIDRWLENTATDCENRLSEPRQIVKSIGELLTSLERFTAYIQIEENFPLEQQQLLNSQADLELVCQEQRSAYQQAAHNLLPWETLANDLSNLIESASSANWEDPNIKELVESLTPYLTTNDEIHHLYLNVERCQQMSAELDLTVPPYPPLGLAFWFRDVMSEKIQTSLTCVNDSVAAMSAIERQREWQLLSDIVMDLDKLLSENYRGLKGYINKTIDYFFNLLKVGKSSHTQAKKQRSIREKYAILQEQHTNFALDTAYQKLHHLTELLDIPKTWQVIAQQYLTQPHNSLNQAITLEKEVRSWSSKIENFLNFCLLLEPLAILDNVNDRFYSQFKPLKEEVESLLSELKKNENKLTEATVQLQIKSEHLAAEQSWWQSVWSTIPERLKRDISFTDIFAPKFLKNVSLYLDSWQKELAEAEAYLNRYEATMQKWIDRLRNPSETDLESISKKYLENVNVVGITCMKAANRSFSQKFSKFDVVIIDEVSKSTPPELLIPALKGKKVVMIGDYRQLPPILDEENLDELADELKVPREKVQFLENSWFKQQFEAATSVQKGITQKLNIQYRMHPQIMEAINQFYNEGDGGLSCGLTDPDNQRSHNVGGKLIREDQHIIWVKIPSDRRYQENRIGTSYQNTKEVACIEKLCEQMNKTWAAKVANGEPKKEIGIITFYGAQLRLIDEHISRTNRFPNLDIRTGTVDRFQGMEKSVVIVSMVRNNSQKIVGFAKTPERVNVAFSRAKELLIIVGCHDLFTTIPIYQEVSKVVERYRGFIDVSSIL